MTQRRARAGAGVAVLALALVASGCSAAEVSLGWKEDLDNPTGRCVAVNQEYDRPVYSPVDALDGADVLGEAPTLPPRRVKVARLDELAEGPATRAGAEAYALAWVVHALDSKELGDLRPLLGDHGPRLRTGQIDALLKSHCDAYVSAGERRLDLDRPVWVRSSGDQEAVQKEVQVEVAGTVAWLHHPYPRQDLSMRIDVGHTDEGWRLTAVQGPTATPVMAPPGSAPDGDAPAGSGWRRAR